MRLLAGGSTFVLIAESWFTDKQSDAQVSMCDYNLFRFDRQGRKGREVCIYVHNKISDCKIVEFDAVPTGIELLWLECTISNQLFFDMI